MNFTAYRSTYQVYRQAFSDLSRSGNPLSFEEYYRKNISKKLAQGGLGDHSSVIPQYDLQALEDGNRLHAELHWHRANRPYYNLHPKLVPIFNRNRLDFPAKYIEFPYLSFAIHFENHDPAFVHPDGKHRLYNCFVCRTHEVIHIADLERIPNRNRLVVYMDFGEREYFSGWQRDVPVLAWRQLAWQAEETIEEAMNTLPERNPNFYEGLVIPEEMILLCLKMVLSISFLVRQESPLIVPHILKSDQREYEHANQERQQELHRRASRTRGQVGYCVGVDRMFDLGHVGSPSPGKEHVKTGKEMTYADIVTGHWKLVRYGPKLEAAKIQWIMPYVRGEGKPFKERA